MQISCPCCAAKFPLEGALNDEAARELMGVLAQLPAELSRPLAAYLGLFRAAARNLAWERALKLAREALDLSADRAALGRALSDTVETLRDKRAQGEFKPLSNHNYLKRVLESVSARAEALPVVSTAPAKRGPDSKTGQAFVALEGLKGGR